MPTSAVAKIGNPEPGTQQAASQALRSVCHDLILKLSSRISTKGNGNSADEATNLRLGQRYAANGDYVPQCTLQRNTLRVRDEEELSHVTGAAAHSHPQHMCALKSSLAPMGHTQRKVVPATTMTTHGIHDITSSSRISTIHQHSVGPSNGKNSRARHGTSWNGSVSLEAAPTDAERKVSSRLRNAAGDAGEAQERLLVQHKEQQQAVQQLEEARPPSGGSAASSSQLPRKGERASPGVRFGGRAQRPHSSTNQALVDHHEPPHQASAALGTLSAHEIGMFDTQAAALWEAESRWVLERLNYPTRYLPLEDKAHRTVGGQSAAHRSGGGHFPNPLDDPIRNGTTLLLLLQHVAYVRSVALYRHGASAAAKDGGHPRAVKRSASSLLGKSTSSAAASASSPSSVSYGDGMNNFVKALKQARSFSQEWTRQAALQSQGGGGGGGGGVQGSSGLQQGNTAGGISAPPGSSATTSPGAGGIPHCFLHLKVDDVLQGSHLEELWGLIHHLLIHGILYPLVHVYAASNTGGSAAAVLRSFGSLETSAQRKRAWLRLLTPIPRAFPLATYSNKNLQRLDSAVCSFLHNYGVVLDIKAMHKAQEDGHAEGDGLVEEGDDEDISLWALTPTALQAPYLPARDKWQMALQAPKSIVEDHVLPFLCNGTVLCELLNRCLGCDLQPVRNPRLPSKCRTNIEMALMALRKYEPSISSMFLSGDGRSTEGARSSGSATMMGSSSWSSVYSGDRMFILMLLEDIMRLASGGPARPKAGPTPSETPFFWRSPIPTTATPTGATTTIVSGGTTGGGGRHVSIPQRLDDEEEPLLAVPSSTGGSSSGAPSSSWLKQHHSHSVQVTERRGQYDGLHQQGGTASTAQHDLASREVRSGTLTTHRITNTHLLLRQNSIPRDQEEEEQRHQQNQQTRSSSNEKRRGYSPVPEPNSMPPPQPHGGQLATTTGTSSANYYQRSNTNSPPTTVKLLSHTVTTGVPSSGRSVIASNDGGRLFDGSDVGGSEDDGHLVDGTGDEDPQPEAAYSLYLSRMQVTPEECDSLRAWFYSKVGYGYKYHAPPHVTLAGPTDLNLEGAVHGSTTIGAGSRNTGVAQCFVFQDGVVLAHLISILCYHKCPALAAIQKHPKTAAARRFNLRRCITYLQQEKKMFAHYLCMDQALECGEPRAVVLVLRELRSTFKNHRGVGSSASAGPSPGRGRSYSQQQDSHWD